MILNSPTISGSLTVTGNIIASGSITLSGSVASASYAATASFVALAQSASNAVSAATASFANAFTVASTLTAQTLVVQTITSSVDFVTGSTRFGSILGNTHVFSGSVTMNPGGLFVSSSGTVGIGTTSNTAKLEIQNSPANDWGISVWGNSTVSQSYGGIVRGGTNSSDVSFRVNNAANSSTYFTVQGNGNVGIGTTSPTSGLFQVGVANSGIYFDVSTQYTPKIIAAGTISDIQIQSVGNGGNVYLNAPGTTSIINFQTNSGIRMTINSIGNVGIGVVPSTIYASSKALEIAYAGSGLWSYGQTNIYLTSNAYYTTAGAWAYGGTGAASVFQQDGGAFAWKIAGSGTAGGAITFTQAMTFTSGGELFINQLAADGGEAKLRVSQAGSYWNTEFRHTYSTQYWVLFRYNSTGIGSITGNGSNTAFNTSSDIRLKENIKPIENAIEKISKLKPVTYNWKNTGLEDDGFVAQDLLELDEFKHRVNSVGKAEDGSELYGVDYMRFTSILTAAIQELKTQNDALQSRIETLESK